MPVLFTIASVLLETYYFKGVTIKFLREGIALSFSWFFISIIIDLFIFLPVSHMQMSITKII
jgi:hypothetical protein